MYEPLGKFSEDELKMITDLGEGFLESYVHYANVLTDAPDEFHWGAALGLMSSLVGREGFDPLLSSYPNLWIVFLGPTTIYRKTTSLRIARKILLEVCPEALIASDFSPQALIGEFADRANKASVLFRDEVSGFFRTMGSHDYMAGTKELLIKLFDGDDFERKLRKEEITVTNPYFVWICGGVTEKLMAAVSEEDIFSGLMIRFLFVNPEKRGPTRPLSYETTQTDWEREDLCNRLKAFRTHLTTPWSFETGSTLLAGTAPYHFVMRSRALKRYNKFVTGLENDSHGDSTIDKINSRIGPLALKLMVLFATDHWTANKILFNTVFVDEAVLLKALYWAELFRHHSIRTLVGVAGSKREHAMDRILTYIGANPGVRRGVLMRRFKLNAREMTETKQTLVERDLVKILINTSKTRPSETYFLVGEEKES